MVRGLERDQRVIYPSRLFRLLQLFLPPVLAIYQRLETRRFQNALKRR
jgi:hypothetical protein